MQSTCRNRNGPRGTVSRILPIGSEGAVIAFVLLAASGAFGQWPEADAPPGNSADQHSTSQFPADHKNNQRLARLMLTDARQWAGRGWTDAARGLARRATELNVAWRPDEESPESFLRRLDKDPPPSRRVTTERPERTTNLPQENGPVLDDGPQTSVSHPLFNDASNTGSISTEIAVPTGQGRASGAIAGLPTARPAAAMSRQHFRRGVGPPERFSESIARPSGTEPDHDRVLPLPSSAPLWFAGLPAAALPKEVANSPPAAASSKQAAGRAAGDQESPSAVTGGGPQADEPKRGSPLGPPITATLLATVAGAVCAAAGTLVLTHGIGRHLPSLVRIEVVHRSAEPDSAHSDPGVDRVARRVRRPLGRGELDAAPAPGTLATAAADDSSCSAAVDPILECVIEQNRQLQHEIAERSGKVTSACRAHVQV